MLEYISMYVNVTKSFAEWVSQYVVGNKTMAKRYERGKNDNNLHTYGASCLERNSFVVYFTIQKSYAHIIFL